MSMCVWHVARLSATTAISMMCIAHTFRGMGIRPHITVRAFIVTRWCSTDKTKTPFKLGAIFSSLTYWGWRGEHALVCKCYSHTVLFTHRQYCSTASAVPKTSVGTQLRHGRRISRLKHPRAQSYRFSERALHRPLGNSPSLRFVTPPSW